MIVLNRLIHRPVNEIELVLLHQSIISMGCLLHLEQSNYTLLKPFPHIDAFHLFLLIFYNLHIREKIDYSKLLATLGYV